MADHRRPVIWSSDAHSDLSNIWNYYANVAGRHPADKIVRKIGEACRLLDEHPFGGRARNEVRSGLRSITASPYIVFYRVTDDATEVVRVLDARRDLDEIFARDLHGK